jgi:hypothetical protein
MIDSIYIFSANGEALTSVDLADSNNWSWMHLPGDDSCTIVVVSNLGRLKFPNIQPKYLNADGEIEIFGPVYQDFFPENWAPLKNHNRYATLRFSKDKDHFFFIATDYSSNYPIGQYYEKW